MGAVGPLSPLSHTFIKEEQYATISNGMIYYYYPSSAATTAWFYSITFSQARGEAGPVNDKCNCSECLLVTTA
jgi:hypothetical protein